MPTQLHIPVQPAGAREINPVVSMLSTKGHTAYFASGVPLFVHRDNDSVGRRVAAVQMMELRLARQDELSEALKLNRTTLYRQQLRVKAHGVLGVVDSKRGPQGRHRLTAEKRRRVESWLKDGMAIRQAAKRVGVSEGTIRHAIRTGDLSVVAGVSGESRLGPRERSVRDAQASGGMGVKRHTERALARLGQLGEAKPQFVAAEAIRYGGALLALPVLLTLGLLEVGERTYGALKQGFYGLQATLLVLTFMALLRIRTPEQLQGHPPGELGVLLGLDRVPEVKTLRRKLWELAARLKAGEFSQGLAERWVEEERDALGVLYVDGHVRPYHGTAHKLPEGYVTRRRLCMPATTDIWVNQEDGQPVFVVTAPANDGLLAMLRREVLGEIRGLVGDRRVTVVFDREGWSPRFFRELDAQGFDVLTYRKGRSEGWPVEEFNRVRGFVDGRRVEYDLAERSVEVLQGFWMREVRRRCEGGHQTAIVTTRKDLAIEVVAYRMFERWRQENFFRYMRQHFALDALVTYAVEPADPERTVPNPQRKVLGRELSKLRLALKGLEQRYGQEALAKGEGARLTRREKKRQEVLIEDIRVHRVQCQQMKERIATLPKRVAVREVLDEQEIVRLSPEAKHLTDTIKMIAYRAETALVRYVAPHYGKSEDEGRALVREMLLSSADIIPDPEAKRLTVRLHSLANARSNKALVKPCEMLNGLKIHYPGTDLTLWYEPPEVA